MAKVHHRIFALVFAVLFFVTSIAFSAAVVWQLRQENKTNSSQTDTSTESNAQGSDCKIGPTEGKAGTVPEVYKPAGDVTKLETTDLKEGSGPAAKAGDCLVVKYWGTLATTGAKFDGNFDQPSDLIFPLGSGQVIEGWDQGMVGMKVGGVRRLVIPSELAYKDQAPSESIPANSDLVFVVELVKIQ